MGPAAGSPPAPPPMPMAEGPQFAPPQPNAPAPQLPVPVDPGQLEADAETERDAELARQTAAEDEFLGTGERPQRGSSMEHPLDRASATLASELRGNAQRLAADLFPNGPAGTVRPSKEAMAAYTRRHWDDPQFRRAMLDRMAPKGPDGNRVPWGVRAFLDLYKQAVEPHRLSAMSTQVGSGMAGAPGFPDQTGFVTPTAPKAAATVDEAGRPPTPGPNSLGA